MVRLGLELGLEIGLGLGLGLRLHLGLELVLGTVGIGSVGRGTCTRCPVQWTCIVRN